MTVCALIWQQATACAACHASPCHSELCSSDQLLFITYLSLCLQDPVMFSGSVRFNLDPFDTAGGDAVIWATLEQVGMAATIRDTPVRWLLSISLFVCNKTCRATPSETRRCLLCCMHYAWQGHRGRLAWQSAYRCRPRHIVSNAGYSRV